MTTEHKIIGAVVLLTLVIIIGGVWVFDKSGTDDSEKLSKPMMGEKMADMGAQHVARDEAHPAYNSNPPTSGWHWVGVAGPGIKNEPVPDELVLHRMEHGGGGVWDRGGFEENGVDKNKEAFNDSSGKKIILTRADLDVPVALTSWGYLLKLDSIDQEKIKEFIETNNDRGPEKAPI